METPKGYCPRCHYPLDPGPCPECGLLVTLNNISHRSYSLARRIRIALLIVLILVAASYPLLKRVNWLSKLPTDVLMLAQSPKTPKINGELYARCSRDELYADQIIRTINNSCKLDLTARYRRLKFLEATEGADGELSGSNESMHWWKFFVDPDKPGKSPYSQDRPEFLYFSLYTDGAPVNGENIAFSIRYHTLWIDGKEMKFRGYESSFPDNNTWIGCADRIGRLDKGEHQLKLSVQFEANSKKNRGMVIWKREVSCMFTVE